MRIFSFFLFLVFCFHCSGQVNYRTTSHQIKKIGTFDPKSVHDAYNPQIQHLEAPLPNGKSYRSYLMRVKEKVAKEYPMKERLTAAERGHVERPALVESKGLTWKLPNGVVNNHEGGTPNDNTLAVSNDGYLITAWNSSIYAYDLNADTAMYWPNKYFNALTFERFVDTAAVVYPNPFDPKILYDPLANRFVLLFLNADRSSAANRTKTSNTIMAFSSSSNPTDSWHIYEIKGNPLNNNTWSDYPAMALTKDELFYTINLLVGDDWINDFQRTVIWQIDKNSGYRGDPLLETQLWDSISYDSSFLRYFRPIQAGAAPAGPNMYFVSNRAVPINFGDTAVYSSDSVFLIEVNNTIASGKATLSVKGGKANNMYHTPPDGRQANGHTLFSNDARVLGGFYHDGQIQFVGASLDTSSGRSGIYHGIIKQLNGAIDVTIEIIGDDSLDLGYPNIAYTGIKTTSHSSIIGFDHTSPTHFAGNSCLYYNGNGRYSKVKILKEGDNYVDKLSGIYERWGDYFGIQRVYNDPKHVWLAGYYGKSNKGSGIWLSKVKAPVDKNDPDTVGLVPVTVEDAAELSTQSLYPNPVVNHFTIEFDMPKTEKLNITIVDLKGSVFKHLLNSTVKKGRNRFSFNYVDIAPGMYFVQARSSSGQSIFREKIIKTAD